MTSNFTFFPKTVASRPGKIYSNMLLSRNCSLLWREGHWKRTRRLLGHIVPWHLLGTKSLEWTSWVTSWLLLQIWQLPFTSSVEVCVLTASNLSGDSARMW